jgi:hypothetical protein
MTVMFLVITTSRRNVGEVGDEEGGSRTARDWELNLESEL